MEAMSGFATDEFGKPFAEGGIFLETLSLLPEVGQPGQQITAVCGGQPFTDHIFSFYFLESVPDPPATDIPGAAAIPGGRISVVDQVVQHVYDADQFGTILKEPQGCFRLFLGKGLFEFGGSGEK